MKRRDAARVLLEVARILELSGANPFRVHASENAAEALAAFAGSGGGEGRSESADRAASFDPPRVPG